MVPRHLGVAYFTIVPGATCGWMQRTAADVRRTDPHVARGCPTLNERALVEWIRFSGGGAVSNLHGSAEMARGCALRQQCAAQLNVSTHSEWCRPRPMHVPMHVPAAAIPRAHPRQQYTPKPTVG